MATTTIKKDAKKRIDNLPDNSSWDDLMHEIYVQQSIESGMADSEAGRTKEVNDVREKYGLSNI